MASFDRVLASFWHPDIEYLRLPPLTDDLVADAEAQLGVTLPLDLIRLLKIQNGGVVAAGCVPGSTVTRWTPR